MSLLDPLEPLKTLTGTGYQTMDPLNPLESLPSLPTRQTGPASVYGNNGFIKSIRGVGDVGAIVERTPSSVATPFSSNGFNGSVGAGSVSTRPGPGPRQDRKHQRNQWIHKIH